MDTAVAKRLESGDVFLVLNLPEKSAAGHDTLAISTIESKTVLGLRDIPPGAHLLWVSGPEAVSRCGYWYLTDKQRGQLRVKQWDRFNETLTDARVENHGALRNIDSIYPSLLPYNYQHQKRSGTDSSPRSGSQKSPVQGVNGLRGDREIWTQLTSEISRELLAGITGDRNASEWLVDTVDTSKGDVHLPMNTAQQQMVKGTEFNFSYQAQIVDTPILQASLSRRGTPQIDSISRILNILNSVGEDSLIGEIQFTFLTGCHLSNYSCLEQWWRLVLQVVLEVQLAVYRPRFCLRLLRTFHAQMVYDNRFLGGEASDTDVTRSSNLVLEAFPRKRGQLRNALTAYKRQLKNLDNIGLGDGDDSEQHAIEYAFVDLEGWFCSHGLDLRSSPVQSEQMHGLAGEDDSDEDWEPVIVELDADGKEVGLVSWD